MACSSSIRPSGSRACSRASCSTTLRDAAERARPDLRARSLDPQPLHAGRDDRQQLVRRALGRWPGATADNVARAGDRSPTTALRMRVGRRRADELEAIIRRGRPARRDLRAHEARCATATATWCASAIPRFRAACPATTWTSCCRRTASTSPAPWSARGHLRDVLEATLRLVPWPRARTLARARLPGHVHGGRPRAGRAGAPADRPGGHRRPADATTCARRAARRRPALLPEGNGYLLVEFGGDTKAEADARRATSIDAAAGAPRRAAMKLFDDPDRKQKLWKVRESGLGATARVPGLARHLGGLGGFRGSAERSAATSATRHAAERTATTAPSTAISGRAACTRASTSI